MRGVAVDFYTLYDPIALAGAILTYTPFYRTIYASKHSFWLDATPCSGHGLVPIDGLKLLEERKGASWGMEWLRNWARKNLNVAEDELAKENLYASIMLIQEAMNAGILKVLSDDDQFMRIGGKILKDKNLSAGILLDSMMPFGEGRENGFYLSPDLGHSLSLGVGLIFEETPNFRFSTCNPLIMKRLEHLFSPDILKRRVEITRRPKYEWKIDFRSKPLWKNIFGLLEQNKTLGPMQFLKEIESSEKDVMFFTPQVSLERATHRWILNIQLTCRILKFAD